MATDWQLTSGETVQGTARNCLERCPFPLPPSLSLAPSIKARPGGNGEGILAGFTRAELALKLEPMIQAKAKGNQATGKSGKGKPLLQNSVKAVDTQKELAKVAKVFHDTIAKAKVIQAKASEETSFTWSSA